MTGLAPEELRVTELLEPQAPVRRCLELNHLLSGDIAWEPFRPGIEIIRLHGEASKGSSSALLRYAPGARLASHRHTGFEHILVLSGSQCDENGRYGSGTLVVNVPGSKHDVWSDEGCVVLAIWQAPVMFESVP